MAVDLQSLYDLPDISVIGEMDIEFPSIPKTVQVACTSTYIAPAAISA